MRFASIVAIGLAAAAGALAAPTSHVDVPLQAFGYDPAFATEPVRVRKEWRQLSIPQRKEYIAAVRCLHATPGIYRDLVPSSLTLFEDFAAEHKLKTYFVHQESQFLPWHRYLVWTYENALRKQCGYTGTQPYWDYSLDVTPPSVLRESPIFDVEHGFGGDGETVPFPFSDSPPSVPAGTGGGCLQDGPFKDWTLHIATRNRTGPRDDRCLTRSINTEVGRDWCNSVVSEAVLRQPDYVSMYLNMQGSVAQYAKYFGVHACGHFIVGGPKAMMDVFLGPTDPLFYLHHANIDRIWWNWQLRDFENRTTQITGPLRPMVPPFSLGNFSTLPDENITLDWPIDMGKLAPPVRTAELMDIGCNILSYRYTDPRAVYEDGEEVSDGGDYGMESEDFEREVKHMLERWENFRNGPTFVGPR